MSFTKTMLLLDWGCSTIDHYNYVIYSEIELEASAKLFESLKSVVSERVCSEAMAWRSSYSQVDPTLQTALFRGMTTLGLLGLLNG